MRFATRYYTKFRSPYWGGFVSPDKTEPNAANKGKLVVNEHMEGYSELDESAFMDVLKELLDCPANDMTDADVHTQFDLKDKVGNVTNTVAPNHVSEIKGYYNGRRALMNQIIADVDAFKEDTGFMTFERKYPMGQDLNCFSVVDNEDEKNTTQLDGYIWVKAEKPGGCS
jgi:hypothetical protein